MESEQVLIQLKNLKDIFFITIYLFKGILDLHRSLQKYNIGTVLHTMKELGNNSTIMSVPIKIVGILNIWWTIKKISNLSFSAANTRKG